MEFCKIYRFIGADIVISGDAFRLVPRAYLFKGSNVNVSVAHYGVGKVHEATALNTGTAGSTCQSKFTVDGADSRLQRRQTPL